jgi:hypothetical protein
LGRSLWSGDYPRMGERRIISPKLLITFLKIIH